LADGLLTEFREGRTASLARAISVIENHEDGYEQLLSDLSALAGKAHYVGITGPPGAGKSTLTMQLAKHWRTAGLTVGIIAVDPSSALTGGALLGDRIRMAPVALDPGIYIRSLGTRGALGGLSAAASDAALVLDAFGFDRVVIETVGVGQSELAIARASDSCVLVLVPESGDAIQTLKAGLMEVADIFVVNKGDRPGADNMRRDVAFTIHLRPKGSWTPPVLTTVATTGTGVNEVIEALDRHRAYLSESGELAARRRERRLAPGGRV
jgi:GTPase